MAELLPDHVAEAFSKLGDMQRGKPESAMLKLAHFCPGLTGFVAEHVGDLTHRMTHNAHWDYFGYDEVNEKTRKMLDYLESKYGFYKDRDEQIKKNAKYEGEDPVRYWGKVNKLMNAYSKAHARLPVYNELHWLGREAAIQYGDWKVEPVVKALKEIRKYTKNYDKYQAKAAEYTLRGGRLVEYR